MTDLFRSECLRLMRTALMAMAFHIAVLAMLFLANGPAVPFLTNYALQALVYMATGAAFGVYQVFPLKGIAPWTWLMNRPLAPWRIFAAHALAAISMLALAILLPRLAHLAQLKLGLGHLIDLRLILSCFHFLLFAMLGWCAAVFATLHPKRGAALILFLPFMQCLPRGTAWAMFLAQGVTLVFLAAAAAAVFRPDRQSRPANWLLRWAPWPAVLAGAYVVSTLALALIEASLEQHLPPQLVAKHSTQQLFMSDPTWRILDTHADPAQQALAKAMQADAKYPQAALFRMPAGQPRNALLPALSFFNPFQNQIWTFSHDDMRFHARDAKRQVALDASIGPDATRGFSSVPVDSLQPRDPDIFMTPAGIYAFQRGTSQFNAELELSGGNQLVSPGRQVGRVFYAMTEQGLLRFDIRTHTQSLLPYEKARGRAVSAYVKQWQDQTLVTLVYDGVNGSGWADTSADVVSWPAEGAAVTVGSAQERIALEMRTQVFKAAAPPMAYVANAFMWLPSLGEFHNNAIITEHNDAGLVMYAFNAVLAALLGFWYLRRTTANKVAWMAICIVFGVAGFLTLWVMERRQSKTALALARSWQRPQAA